MSQLVKTKKPLTLLVFAFIIFSSLGSLNSANAASCPSGTYKNSIGNCVKSPSKSSTWPTGATAKCLDGTYSYSQSRRGTCSHHGGVSQWK
jgi:hypothetical protein